MSGKISDGKVAHPNNSLSIKTNTSGCDGTDERSSVLEKAALLGFVGQCVPHVSLLTALHRVAATDAEVLLVGETGVGKELYAKFIHLCSDRHHGEFVSLNCGSIPDTLFENEMFGHSQGAYTDARDKAPGLVAAAEKGTLFLDEIHGLSHGAQVKLLRLLQEKEYRRLGETRLRRADIRVVAATNEDPRKLVKENRLRADLFYRLNVVLKEVPPLRERGTDIILLATTFLKKYCQQYERKLELSAGALRVMQAYDWPGNVRELENLIRSLVCESNDDTIDELALSISETPELIQEYVSERLPIYMQLSFSEAKNLLIEEFEFQYVRAILCQTNGNLCQAARLAGKPVRSLRRTAEKLGVDLDEFRSPDRQVKSGDPLPNNRKQKPR